MLSLAGSVTAGALVSPAQADCARASVWVWKSKQGRDYKYGPYQCVGPDHGDANGMETGWGAEGYNGAPEGTPTGFGFHVWLP